MRLFLVFKVLLFTVLVPGSVIGYVPYLFIVKAGVVLQWDNPLRVIPAALCLLIGIATYIRCAWDFAVQGLGTPAPVDPPKKLVVTGLYRYTRNPMYQGVILLLLAEWLLFPGSGLITYALSIAAVFHVFVAFHEERVLSRRFGDAYLDYCRQVPRWGFSWQAVRLSVIDKTSLD